MKITIRVRSDIMGERFNEFPAIYEDTESSMKVIWKDRFEDDTEDSIFEINYNKMKKELVMVRKGPVRSRMVFKQGCKTNGTISTQYGTVPLEIDTASLTVPNMVTNILKIEYSLSEGIENTYEAQLIF